MSAHNRENNEQKIKSLEDLMKETFKRVLNKGFYGKACFVVTIQDGAIQDIEKQETEKRRIR